MLVKHAAFQNDFGETLSKTGFWGKSDIQQKKTLPGSLQTIVRSGEASQMVPFSKLGNWQIQNFFNGFPLKQF